MDTRICNSHHDAILTKFSLDFFENTGDEATGDVPTEVNKKHKIIWSEDVQPYADLINPVLKQLRDDLLVSDSPSCMSILLQQTNTILSSAAKSTQKVVDLSLPPKPKSVKPPPEVSLAAKNLKKAQIEYKRVVKCFQRALLKIENVGKGNISKTAEIEKHHQLIYRFWNKCQVNNCK